MVSRTNQTKTISVDLSAAANRGLTPSTDNDDVQAWTGDKEIDLTGLKVSELDVHGVVFTLLNPAVPGNRALLGLRADGGLFATSAELEVGRTAKWIYLLHTGTWMFAAGVIGTVELVYADGSRHEEQQVEGRQMAHFLHGGSVTHACRHRLEGNQWLKGVYVYASCVKNPFPEKPIAALRFLAETENKDRPIWLVLAVSSGTGRNLFGQAKGLTVKVDAKVPNGHIRRINGTNLGPSLQLESAGLDITDDLKALDIPLMRLHDAPWEQGNFNLVDIPHVFPLFHADHKDPASYFFAHTDDYLKQCLATGAKILYRLGVTIEHTRKNYFTVPPADFTKWAEICCQVIAHYNDGWASGFHHKIEYWEIWNEADLGRKMWTGTWDEYVRLYVTAAKMIKVRFPDVKVGGPAMMMVTMDRLEDHIPALLDACKSEGAPLDFFSWHSYSAQVPRLVNTPFILRRLLDDHGFTKTELHLNEWHYSGGNAFSVILSPSCKTSGEARSVANQTLTGPEGAAYACAGLTALQDTPVDMANYYTSSMMTYFGIFDCFGARNKCYHALSAFNYMTKCAVRVKAGVEGGGDSIYALAGLGKSGELSVLVSCPFTGKCKVKVNVSGLDISARGCELRVIDAAHDLTSPSRPLKHRGPIIVLDKATDWSVFLLEFS